MAAVQRHGHVSCLRSKRSDRTRKASAMTRMATTLRQRSGMPSALAKTPTVIGWYQADGKAQAEDFGAAGERRHRREQSGKIHRRHDGENRGREYRGDLGAGKRGNQLAESGRRHDVDDGADQQCQKRSLERHVEEKDRHQEQKHEIHHGDRDVGKLLAEQELELGDRGRAEVGDRAGFLFAHHRDRRHDRRDQTQHQHEDARHHRVDAEKGLVVAKAGLDIVVGPAIRASRAPHLALQAPRLPFGRRR